MEIAEHDKLSDTTIYGLKIHQPEPGCYSLSFRHAGDFRLADYEELDFEVVSARLVRR